MSEGPRDQGAELRAEMLIQAAAWAGEHRALLGSVYRSFRRAGRWPLLREIDGGAVDARAADSLVRAPIGLTGESAEGRVALFARALRVLPEARGLLEDAVALLVEAVRLYLEDESLPPTLESKAATARLGGDWDRSKAAAELLRNEPRLSGLWVVVDDRDWAWMLDDAVLDYRSATTVDKYLDIQAWLLWPDGRVPQAMLAACRAVGSGAKVIKPANLVVARPAD